MVNRVASGVCLNESSNVRHFAAFKTSLTVAHLIQLLILGLHEGGVNPGSPFMSVRRVQPFPHETRNSSL